MRTLTLLAVLVVGASIALPALADPENQGRVKVKVDNPRTQSTVPELQGIVVLCAKDDNSCQPKAEAKGNPTKKTRQHNQSDVEFIRERAN